MSINYWRISLRRTLSRKFRNIVKFVSITHSERNIWNGPIVAIAISREKRKPVLELRSVLTFHLAATHLMLLLLFYRLFINILTTDIPIFYIFSRCTFYFNFSTYDVT
jgi:hypothetical protein